MTQTKHDPGTSTENLPALRFGTRVRCADDAVEGRIVWANGVSVKIRWDDNEEVTWKRAELTKKGLVFLEDAEEPLVRTEAPEAPKPSSLSLLRTVRNKDKEDVVQAGLSDPATTGPAQAKQPAESQEKKMSALNAAIRILAETRQPMNCQQLIGAMAIKGYWTSPGGRTPAATLYSSFLRELAKGAESRLVKLGRGTFAYRS